LTRKQKKFIRENYPKLSIEQMARQLKIGARDVSRNIREMGIESVKSKSLQISQTSKICKALKRYPIAIGLVLTLALVLRLIHLWEVCDTSFFLHLHADPAMYHRWAVEITQGDYIGKSRPVFYLSPLYPYFLAVIYAFAGPSSLMVCLIQVLISTLSTAIIYHLGRRLFGPVIGLLSGLLAAVYGLFIFYSSLLLGATLIIFLDLLMLLFLVEGMRSPAWWKWILAGICFGLSADARGNVILFGLFVIPAIVIFTGWKSWRRWLQAVVLFSIASIIAISPLTLHNWLVGRDFIPLTSNAGANLFIGNNINSDGIYMHNARYKGRPMGLSVREQQANFPEVAKKELKRENLKPSEISNFWVKKTWEEIDKDFSRWLRLMGNKTRYFFNAYEVPNNRNYYFSRRFSFLLHMPLVTFGFITPLALFGMVILWRSWRRRGILYGFFLAHFLALIAFFVNARYRLVVIPILLMYAAAMLRWIFLQGRRKRFLRLGVIAGILLLLYLIIYSPVPHINYRANYYNLGNAHRDLGQPEKALRCYDESIRISPVFYYGYLNKGKILARMGQQKQLLAKL
jgi:4-amino-4-deoxy-L-arabinose transferase-like glycosyltransferase